MIVPLRPIGLESAILRASPILRVLDPVILVELGAGDRGVPLRREVLVLQPVLLDGRGINLPGDVGSNDIVRHHRIRFAECLFLLVELFLLDLRRVHERAVRVWVRNVGVVRFAKRLFLLVEFLLLDLRRIYVRAVIVRRVLVDLHFVFRSGVDVGVLLRRLLLWALGFLFGVVWFGVSGGGETE